MRLTPMAPHRITLAALVSLSLIGCGQNEPTAPSSAESAQTAESTSASAKLVPSAVSPATPGPPSASRDPQVVVKAWADAVRARDWPAAYGYWGDHGTRSGKPLAQFTAQWNVLQKPLVVVGKGDQEGAAGSLYYTVPVTISDGGKQISGELVLRRVNDVDGASAEQLRWHIDSTTLQP